MNWTHERENRERMVEEYGAHSKLGTEDKKRGIMMTITGLPDVDGAPPKARFGQRRCSAADVWSTLSNSSLCLSSFPFCNRGSVKDWVWLTWILILPLSAQLCLGWWGFGRSGLAAWQNGGALESVNKTKVYDQMRHPVVRLTACMSRLT